MDKIHFPKEIPRNMSIIDLPGFNNCNYEHNMTSYIKNDQSFLRISILSDKETEKTYLVLRGEKVNHLLKPVYNKEKNDWSLDSNEYIPLGVNLGEFDMNTRREGPFKLLIPIPFNYMNILRDIKWEIFHGQLQITFTHKPLDVEINPFIVHTIKEEKEEM